MVFVAMSPSVFLGAGVGPFWETGGYLSSYNRPGHPKITLDTQNSKNCGVRLTPLGLGATGVVFWCPMVLLIHEHTT